jgi:hypothetical protein
MRGPEGRGTCPMNLVLSGSCVTRDIFGPNFENSWNNLYIRMSFNRSSLISLASEPIEIDVTSNPNLNPYERRALSDDLHKTFYRYLSKLIYNNHYLLIDFIEERFNLFFYEGKYATVSNEFVKSGISETLKGKILGRLSPEIIDKWEQSCLFYIDQITRIFPSDRIVLHKAVWMKEYLENGTLFLFPNQEEIGRQNQMLQHYYDFFLSNCPDVRVIDMQSHGFKADRDHIWGLGAMHYEKRYYQQCMEYLLGMPD